MARNEMKPGIRVRFSPQARVKPPKVKAPVPILDNLLDPILDNNGNPIYEVKQNG